MSSIIIDLKTTGFGNQIKTKIINLDNIANALRINPDRLVAIISEDIGTKVNTDNEFNGKITNQDIKNVLYKNNLL
jgi:predicted TIM-barrel fold metal-dependent hydrolase